MIQQDIRQRGWEILKVLVGTLQVCNAVLLVRAVGSSGEGDDDKSMLLVYRLDGLEHRLREWLRELLLYSCLCHPHLTTFLAIFRTSSAVCIRVQHSNGGCVFPMIVRGGGSPGSLGGLPQPAAVFLVQQAVLAVEFLHVHGKFLHALSPQALRVHWNAQGVPILKIIGVPLPPPAPRGGQSGSGEATARPVATMWTAPHLLRRGADPPPAGEEEARFLVACDVWALCVVAYFTVFGAWPFSKEEIATWADAAAEAWDADKRVPFAGLEAREPQDEHEAALLRFLADTFNTGRLHRAQFAATLGDLALIKRQPWFQKDLPEGAESMTVTYSEKTEERRESREFQQLEREVERVLSAMDSQSP